MNEEKITNIDQSPYHRHHTLSELPMHDRHGIVRADKNLEFIILPLPQLMGMFVSEIIGKDNGMAPMQKKWSMTRKFGQKFKFLCAIAAIDCTLCTHLIKKATHLWR